MRTLWQDLKFGARLLAKAPGFTAIAVLTLALGIGANTAVFTVVYGVLLRPLPFPEPDRLVQLAESYKTETSELSLDMRGWERLRQYTQVVERYGAYTMAGFNLAAGTEAEHVRGMPVSSGYFQTLGVHPSLGRDFLPEEDRGDGQRVAILAHNLWVRRFGGDPDEVGQKILLNGEAYTVIGIMPPGFDAFASSFDAGAAPELWVPLALVAKTAGSGANIDVIARLKSGAGAAELQAQMAVVTQDFRKMFGGDQAAPEWHMLFVPYRRMVGADARPYLLVLLGAIGFVLLIACANVANLLLARGGSRGREMAVRISMGASPWRLLRQLLAEAMLIALAGGALGVAFASAGLGSLLALAPVNLPRAGDVHLNGAVLAFTLLVALVTGVLFGLAPAAYAMRTNLNDTLKEGAGRASAGAGRARLRQGLVVGELAISLVLLTGAGLMIATFAKLLNTNPGFNPHHVLSTQFWLTGSKYRTTPEIANFYRALEQRIGGLPGVENAAVVAAGLPLERGGNNAVRIAGEQESEFHSADYREITPGYFAALGVPLKQGRLFTSADSEKSAPVVIVNETFVRKYLSGREALGEHVQVSGVWSEVVGVVGDMNSYVDQPPEPATFIPAAQASFETSKLFEGWFPRSILVRTSGDPLRLGQSVREAVKAVDASVPTGAIRSMDHVLSRSLALRSFLMALLSLFGALALVLASVGVYGVMAYAVSQRTREIGVRMALGARPRDVLRLVLAEGLRLVLAGVALGLIAAFFLTRLLQGMIYGVSLHDPLVAVAVNVIMIAVAILACCVPARRAMRVDPIQSLRYE
jgi:predicted permease